MIMKTHTEVRRILEKKIIGSSQQENEMGEEVIMETIHETPVDYEVSIQDLGDMQIIKTKKTVGKPKIKYRKTVF